VLARPRMASQFKSRHDLGNKYMQYCLQKTLPEPDKLRKIEAEKCFSVVQSNHAFVRVEREAYAQATIWTP
jgi:hypothetical protein